MPKNIGLEGRAEVC